MRICLNIKINWIGDTVKRPDLIVLQEQVAPEAWRQAHTFT